MDNDDAYEIGDSLEYEENGYGDYDICDLLEGEEKDYGDDICDLLEGEEKDYGEDICDLLECEEKDYGDDICDRLEGEEKDYGDDCDTLECGEKDYGDDFCDYLECEEKDYADDICDRSEYEEKDYGDDICDLLEYEENDNVDEICDSLKCEKSDNCNSLGYQISRINEDLSKCELRDSTKDAFNDIKKDQASDIASASKDNRIKSVKKMFENLYPKLDKKYCGQGNYCLDKTFNCRTKETINDTGANDFECISNSSVESEPALKESQLISLKQNCLNCVVNNFKIFNKAFKSSSDLSMIANLTYLQRVFTPDIISGLLKKEALKNGYLRFLINNHLKELDVTELRKNGCSMKVIERRIASVGHGLTKVSLCPPGCWTRMRNLFSLLPNIEVLRFDYCNDEALKYISFYCSKLRELYIKGGYLTGAGLKLLYRTGSLIKVLSLKDVNLVESTIVDLLQNMPYLEILDCRNLPYKLYNMHKKDFKNNTLKNVKKYKLIKLDISDYFNHNKMDDDEEDMCLSIMLKICIEVCPNIKLISIEHDISEIEFHLFSLFVNLETLYIYHDNDYDFGSPTTEKCANFNNFLSTSGGLKLKNLLVSNVAISLSDLIDNLSKLESLSLIKVNFHCLETNPIRESRSLKSLSRLYLKCLNFSKPKNVETVNEILLCSPSLNYLCFQNIYFQDYEIIAKLEKYYGDSTVQFLVFRTCDVTLDMLKSIVINCPSLKALTIDDCENIRLDDVLRLKQLRNAVNSFVDIVFKIQEYDYEEEYVGYDSEFDYTID